MANWTPGGFLADFFRTMGKHVPPPAGLKPPFLWGTEERLNELFRESLSSLRAELRSFVWRFPSAEYYVEYMRGYYGRCPRPSRRSMRRDSIVCNAT